MATRAVLLLMVLALGACAGSPSASESADVAPAREPLVHLRWTGGLCPEGTCTAEQWILHDGTVVADGDAPPPWRIPPERMARLVAAVDGANDNAIRARPFVGTCPTAFDGQEVTYTFFTRHGPVRISSCETAIDTGEGPWVELEAALHSG